jgi:hypothetical protein
MGPGDFGAVSLRFYATIGGEGCLSQLDEARGGCGIDYQWDGVQDGKMQGRIA